MEDHPIPQHIASFEFKLFGNLTVKQFVTLIIPMSIAALIFFSNIPPIFRLPTSAIIGIFGIFIALVPIGGRSFDKWVVIFIKAILSPTQRIWVKEQKIPQFLSVVIASPSTRGSVPEVVTGQGRERLMAYLRSLPFKEASPLDLREQLAIERLGLDLGKKGTVFSRGEAGRLPPPIIWQTFAPSLPQINLFAQAPQSLPVDESAPVSFQSQIPQATTKVMAAPASAKITDHAKPYVLPGLEKKLTAPPQYAQPTATQAQPVELIKIPKTVLASETNFAIENVIPIQTPDRQIRLIPSVGKTRVRKLHFAPPVGFDLSNLPIRGEKHFEISEELKKRYHLPEESPPVILPTESKLPPPLPKAPESKKIGSLPKTAHLVPKPTVTLKTPQDVSFKAQAPQITDTKISITGEKSINVPLPSASLSRAQIVPLTNRPNVISGLVTDINGSPVEEAILVVHDQNGIPVRALKTNKLGQFLSATPLSSGAYSIEVESDLATFQPFTINLEGQVIQPMQIKAEGGSSA